MGGALAWLQSQFLIGCCPGNGTSDLIYPLTHPFPYAHSTLAHWLLCRTLFPPLFSAAELNLFSSQVWLSPRRAGKKVMSGNAFSCCYAGGHGEGIYEHAVFLVKERKYKQDADCKTALVSIYIVDSNFIPLREIAGKLILGSHQTTHGEQCLCMTELCHRRRWWCLRTCSRIKMFQWIGFHADGSCGPKSCNFPQLWRL